MGGANNPLKALTELGQSVWYDYIRRDLVRGGGLARLVAEDDLRGMTSNPTIFQKAIGDTDLYDDQIRQLGRSRSTTFQIFEGLAVTDVREAADVFRPVYEETGGEDGFVSIEVGPHLARDTQGSVAEARRLWSACERPNVMVKIPGTREGVPAIRQCLAEGININITLLFSLARYREVMEAYLSAMEERVSAGRPVERIRSVASFFVSRVDTNVDKKLDAVAGKESGPRVERARELRGKVAIANARLAYAAFEEVFRGNRFTKLAARRVALQRPLWASTSTKDPAYPELYYAEALVAPDSVDTMPPETFEAYRKRGQPRVRIRDGLDAARAAFAGIAELGIDEAQVFQELEDEGVRKFSESYDSLMKTLEQKEKTVGAA